MRQLFWGSTPPKKLTGMDASIILGVYTPKLLTDMDASIILGVYNPKIIDEHGCVNYSGSLHPQNN